MQEKGEVNRTNAIKLDVCKQFKVCRLYPVQYYFETFELQNRLSLKKDIRVEGLTGR